MTYILKYFKIILLIKSEIQLKALRSQKKKKTI